MSQNSLFAILLRSPWWVSFVVAGLIGVGASVLVPDPYKLAGALGSLPLVGVGCVAAWRQLRAPSAAQAGGALAAAINQPWRDFAATLQSAWQAGGTQVQLLSGPAADLRLAQGGRVTLVCARRWKAATHGAEPLRQLAATMQAEGAADGIYVLAQGALSDSARLFARDNHIAVLQGAALAQLLLRAGPAAAAAAKPPAATPRA